MSIQTRSGIYAFRCLVDGKFYIGQAKNLEVRYNEHIYKLDRKKHRNKHLESAWHLYGKCNFVYGVIEYCSIEHLTSREQLWMDFYESWDQKYGYNIAKDAGAFHRGIRHSAETRRRMSLAHTGMTYSEETKKRMGAASKKKMTAPGMNELLRQRTKKMWESPITRAKILESKRINGERRRKEQLEEKLIQEMSKRIASSIQTFLNPKIWCTILWGVSK